MKRKERERVFGWKRRGGEGQGEKEKDERPRRRIETCRMREDGQSKPDQRTSDKTRSMSQKVEISAPGGGEEGS